MILIILIVGKLVMIFKPVENVPEFVVRERRLGLCLTNYSESLRIIFIRLASFYENGIDYFGL